MSTENIIANYERAQQEKFQRAEAERVKDKTRRKFNAEAVEGCIHSVIEPVLNEQRDKLVAGGYACRVGVTQEQDSHYPDSKSFCSVEIKLDVSRDKEPSRQGIPIFLQYTGGYEGQSLMKVVLIHPALPSISSPIPLEMITKETVQKDFEEFLSVVFKP